MPNVLVVDDNEDTRGLMKVILEPKGLRVLFAVDGMDGIEQARRESPVLIITDIAMPRLNGIEMIEQLRAMPEFKNAPILALTSYGIEKAMEARLAGASHALARPIQNDLLVIFALDLLKMSVVKQGRPSLTSFGKDGPKATVGIAVVSVCNHAMVRR